MVLTEEEDNGMQMVEVGEELLNCNPLKVARPPESEFPAHIRISNI